MGILFGGWAREIEEEYGSYENFKKKNEEYLASPPHEEYKWHVPENINTPKVGKNDIICIWENNEPKDEFFIKRIEENRIYGSYVDGRNDGKIVEWTVEYAKLCSSIEN